MKSKNKIDVGIVIPLAQRVLVRLDEKKAVTKGGIHLPDDSKIPVITGRVIEISAAIESDPLVPVKKYDKVLLNPTRAIPVDFEQDNKLYVVPLEDVIAVFRTDK